MKLAQMYRLADKYVGEGKPDAPVYWAERGRVEIMPIADLKNIFLVHHGNQSGREWLRKDTAKALMDAELAEAVRMGISASCVNPPGFNRQ